MPGCWHDFAPKNRALLAKRDDLQAQIDAWHIARRGQPHDHEAYKAFLAEIGYLLPEGPAFTIDTTNVDPEIARVPGPQLVVPVTNARYALNAANARWGSLYDCLYGTDAMGTPAPPRAAMSGAAARGWSPGRGCFWTRPSRLPGTSHADVRRYHVKDGALLVDDLPLVRAGEIRGLPGQPRRRRMRCCCATTGCMSNWSSTARISSAARDQALLADVQLESALSAIMDCEDSVACVDAEDKVAAYAQLAGPDEGRPVGGVRQRAAGRSTRRLSGGPRAISRPMAARFTLKGRALMWVRNVGHLMTNPAILLPRRLRDARRPDGCDGDHR